MVHPFELGIEGARAVDRDSVASGLIAKLSQRRRVGYAIFEPCEADLGILLGRCDLARRAGAAVVALRSAGQSMVFDHRLNATAPAAGSLTEALSDCEVLIIDEPLGKRAHLRLLGDEPHAAGEEAPGEVLAFVDLGAPPPSSPAEAPRIDRRDEAGLAAIVGKYFEGKAGRVALKGLVLAGGRSRRMGRDKAELSYQPGGPSQARSALLSLEPFCVETYLSVRPNQYEGHPLGELPQMPDRFIDFGPIGGILSAMEHDPAAAWCVVACDLPLLGPETLQHLVTERDPFAAATAFLSAVHPGMPEPLCAIYEPKLRARLFQALSSGKNCPRKVLRNASTKLLEQPNPRALTNVNSAVDFEEVKRLLSRP